MMKFSALIVGCSLLAPLHLAYACGYDGQVNNPFVQGYPGSLSVALATKRAVESKQLTEPKALVAAEGLARVTGWLEQLRRRLQLAQLDNNFSVYLFDSQLWTRFDVLGGNVLMQSHITPKTDGVVLISSEATLSALLNGQLNIDQAQQLNLIRWANRSDTAVQVAFAKASGSLSFFE
ncbi:hypothetical protein HZU75_11650 [Chitinibacter fontanus]|uniref:Uncharacterized protein n=1 Tax=Chitinibacter fontanus TaxID=1737446 RepID=A0A7D5ZHT9_9NEIS|nr:hypothetical protein [Chitinibacter fontanus]QLI82127.1 hypothetical protein HZU75_11650 [Chitinibacter fontanus]